MNNPKIYLVVLILYAGIELYGYWVSVNIGQDFQGFLVADVHDAFAEKGLYMAKGIIAAEKYATIPNVINESEKLLAIDLIVKVFQKVEVKNEDSHHHPTYHYEDKWVQKDDFEWEKSKEWNDERYANPNYKSWPIPFSSELITADGFFFKGVYKLDDNVLKHYFENGGDRTNPIMFRDIDFKIPNYLNKKIDTLYDGFYIGNNSAFGKAEIGDISIRLRAFCSELKTSNTSNPLVYNLFGIYEDTNEFLPYDNHYYLESNKSFDFYEEEIVQYEINGNTFYILFARMFMGIITIIFAYQFIKNR